MEVSYGACRERTIKKIESDEKLPFALDTAKPRMVHASRHGAVGSPSHKVASQYRKTYDGINPERKRDTKW